MFETESHSSYLMSMLMVLADTAERYTHKDKYRRMDAGFNRCVNKVIALLGCYTALFID
jgi:hypothetical protein